MPVARSRLATATTSPVHSRLLSCRLAVKGGAHHRNPEFEADEVVRPRKGCEPAATDR